MKSVVEQTLVLLKPDSVLRGISGEIITRFEKVGLRIVAMRLLKPTKKLVSEHYSGDKGWVRNLGHHTLDSMERHEIDPEEHFGTSDVYKIGKKILSFLIDFLSSGPVIAIVFEGLEATAVVRKIVGTTIPWRAQPGTIRGDYSFDTPAYSINRTMRNIIHAAGTPEEARKEIDIWFPGRKGFVDYERTDHDLMYGPNLGEGGKDG